MPLKVTSTPYLLNPQLQTFQNEILHQSTWSMKFRMMIALQRMNNFQNIFVKKNTKRGESLIIKIYILFSGDTNRCV
jgi:hypothetical protein